MLGQLMKNTWRRGTKQGSECVRAPRRKLEMSVEGNQQFASISISIKEAFFSGATKYSIPRLHYLKKKKKFEMNKV